MSAAPELVLVYDTDLKRPACVLLQAAFGVTERSALNLFEPEDWLVAPTPGMRRLSGTPELWRRVAEITREARPQRRKAPEAA